MNEEPQNKMVESQSSQTDAVLLQVGELTSNFEIGSKIKLFAYVRSFWINNNNE